MLAAIASIVAAVGGVATAVINSNGKDENPSVDLAWQDHLNNKATEEQKQNNYMFLALIGLMLVIFGMFILKGRKK